MPDDGGRCAESVRAHRLPWLVAPRRLWLDPYFWSFSMLITIIVGIIAGFLAGKIMKGSGYGVLMDLVLGLVGGLIGGFVFRSLGIGASGGILWSILIATIGAVLLVWLVRLVSGKRNP